MAGFGASGTTAIGPGILSDCWRREERGKSIAVFTFMPLLGPALGPVAGGFIVQHTTWRWIFWSTSIVCLAMQVVSVFLLRESYAPIILHRKAKALRKQTDNTKLHTEYKINDTTFLYRLGQGLYRPMRMLATQLIIQAVAVYLAYNYGVLFTVITTYPDVWTNIYHEGHSISLVSTSSPWLSVRRSVRSWVCPSMTTSISC